jgi:hypothetical protein
MAGSHLAVLSAPLWQLAVKHVIIVHTVRHVLITIIH